MTLQVALITIGIILIGVIYAFSRYVEKRKHRSGIAATDPSENKDVSSQDHDIPILHPLSEDGSVADQLNDDLLVEQDHSLAQDLREHSLEEPNMDTDYVDLEQIDNDADDMIKAPMMPTLEQEAAVTGDNTSKDGEDFIAQISEEESMLNHSGVDDQGIDQSHSQEGPSEEYVGEEYVGEEYVNEEYVDEERVNEEQIKEDTMEEEIETLEDRVDQPLNKDDSGLTDVEDDIVIEMDYRPSSSANQNPVINRGDISHSPFNGIDQEQDESQYHGDLNPSPVSNSSTDMRADRTEPDIINHKWEFDDDGLIGRQEDISEDSYILDWEEIVDAQTPSADTEVSEHESKVEINKDDEAVADTKKRSERLFDRGVDDTDSAHLKRDINLMHGVESKSALDKQSTSKDSHAHQLEIPLQHNKDSTDNSNESRVLSTQQRENNSHRSGKQFDLVQDRVEPVFDTLDSQSEQNMSNETTSDSEAVIQVPVEFGEFHYPEIEGFEKVSQIDYWVKISGDRDVGRESVLAQYREGASNISKLTRIYGLKIPEKKWCDLEQESEDTRFADLVITMQLADSQGPIDEQEMNKFTRLVSNLSEGTGRGFNFMASVENALLQGQAIYQFTKYYESIFLVNVKPAKDSKFEGSTINRCATQLGLEQGSNSFYVRNKTVGKSKICLYNLANMSDTGEFDFENIKNIRMQGVTFFTKPAVNRSPGAVFSEMVDTAKAFAARVKGHAAAPHCDELTQEDVDRIRESIEKVAKEMEAFGLAPGSDEAMRIF